MAKSKLARAFGKQKTDKAPHLIIVARAGTGKTTTLVEGLKVMKGLGSDLDPSPQQKAIWDAMALSKDARSVCFVAFNVSIAKELKARVPQGYSAMTMHSLGVKAVRDAFGSVRVDQDRTENLIAELLGQDLRYLRQNWAEGLQATKQLVSLCKANLVLPDSHSSRGDFAWALASLASYYDVELNGYQSKVFDLVPRVLEQAKDVARDNCIDFDDMVWLPVVLDLPIFKYDVLLIDECQDLNRCQQALACKAGDRLILCGDPRQAIYGFAGADSESMTRLARELSQTERKVDTLPLTVTRRCGKAIVAEAKWLVPDFEAHETNPAGKISHANYQDRYDEDAGEPGALGVDLGSYRQYAKDGDMVLCRVNAPLVGECFKFLKAGKKAYIQGRDIGTNLVATIKKALGLRGDTQTVQDELATIRVPTLLYKLTEWMLHESQKEDAKRNPNKTRLENLQDRCNCIRSFAEGAKNALEVVQAIERIFADEKQEGIRLSSIHKAKGLEADRVFLLRPKGAECPAPWASTNWEWQQEENLLYTAITRAKEELVYVS